MDRINLKSEWYCKFWIGISTGRIHWGGHETLAARGLEEPSMQCFLIFVFMILKINWPNLLSLASFSAEYLICRHVQMDRQTDELIRVELGNLRFLQVKMSVIEHISLCKMYYHRPGFKNHFPPNFFWIPFLSKLAPPTNYIMDLVLSFNCALESVM